MIILPIGVAHTHTAFDWNWNAGFPTQLSDQEQSE